jgi:hypothetical protein
MWCHLRRWWRLQIVETIRAGGGWQKWLRDGFAFVVALAALIFLIILVFVSLGTPIDS